MLLFADANDVEPVSVYTVVEDLLAHASQPDDDYEDTNGDTTYRPT